MKKVIATESKMFRKEFADIGFDSSKDGGKPDDWLILINEFTGSGIKRYLITNEVFQRIKDEIELT